MLARSPHLPSVTDPVRLVFRRHRSRLSCEDAPGLSSLAAVPGAHARSGAICLSLAPVRAERVEPHVIHLQVEDLGAGRSRRLA
jgi:hypothetical protein